MKTHVGRIAERVMRVHRYVHGASPSEANRELSKTLSKHSVGSEQYAAEWAVCLYIFGGEFTKYFSTPDLFLWESQTRIQDDVHSVVSTRKSPSFDEFKAVLGRRPAVTNAHAVPTVAQPPKGPEIMARKNLLQSDKFRELTGELYIDEQRVSGRTTTIALQTIARAIANPNVVCRVADHHGSTEADLALLQVIKSQVKALGLKFFEFKEADRAVQGAPSVTCNRLGE